MKARVHIFVSGEVQRVFFRYNTHKKAVEYNLNGWVKNLHDGRVEAIFEGERGDVERILEFCRLGPPNARVISVDIQWEPWKGEFENFKVLY